MIKKLNVSFGVILTSIALGLNFAPIFMAQCGGSWTVLILACIGIFCIKYQQNDIKFTFAIEQECSSNMLMLVCLIVYYTSVIIGALRWDFAWETESHVVKTHVINLLGLVMGLFFVVNKQYSRWAAYMSIPFLLLSTYWLNRYVSMTGESAKFALSEFEGAFGSSSNWQVFGMQVFIILGLLMDEKNIIIKILGFLVLLLLYRSIFLCGFATPIGLLIIAHGVLGVIFFFFSKTTRYSKILKLIIPIPLVIGALYAFIAIGTMDENDKRFSDIQYRFKQFREDWRGGGYDYNAGQSRFELINISIAAFKQAPIFGVGGVYPTSTKHTTGGHQSMFDFFGLYGVVGGGAYILFIILCLKNSIVKYRRQQSWFAASQISVTVMFIIGGLVNPCWVGMPVTILFFYGQPFMISPAIESMWRRMMKSEQWQIGSKLQKGRYLSS